MQQNIKTILLTEFPKIEQIQIYMQNNQYTMRYSIKNPRPLRQLPHINNTNTKNPDSQSKKLKIKHSSSMQISIIQQTNTIRNKNLSKQKKSRNSEIMKLTMKERQNRAITRNKINKQREVLILKQNYLFPKKSIKFIYYLSDLLKDWEQYQKSKSIEKELDSIFLDQVMHAMCIFKGKKFEKPPIKPHISVKLLDKIEPNKKTLFFDLDETLIHSSREEASNFYPDQKEIYLQNSSHQVETLNVNIRPFALEVLGRLSECFNLVIFTASDRIYADKVMDLLDPENKYFKGRFYREHCYKNFNSENIKDLRIFEGMDPTSFAIIDNSPISYSYQKENGIPIIPFTNDPKDKELLKIEQFLKSIIMPANDITKVISKTFKALEYARYDTLKELMQCFRG